MQGNIFSVLQRFVIHSNLDWNYYNYSGQWTEKLGTLMVTAPKFNNNKFLQTCLKSQFQVFSNNRIFQRFCSFHFSSCSNFCKFAQFLVSKTFHKMFITFEPQLTGKNALKRQRKTDHLRFNQILLKYST